MIFLPFFIMFVDTLKSILWKDPEESYIPVFDNILIPQKIGDSLIGRDGARDRFVFNDPSLSSDPRVMTIAEVQGREPKNMKDSRVIRSPILVENFNPDEGDVLDFSQLKEGLSLSGTTPQKNSVWLSGRHNTSSDYMLEVDLDGIAHTTEMYVLLAPTDADIKGKKREYDLDNDGVIDIVLKVMNSTKHMTEDMFMFA